MWQHGEKISSIMYGQNIRKVEITKKTKTTRK